MRHTSAPPVPWTAKARLGARVTDYLGHLDLFCGPGGFATGFELAGFRTLVGLDHHAPSLATYQRNHPRAKTILNDIRAVETEEIHRLLEGQRVDVISAGVPCEGFSMSNRNRTKFVDERNFLFLEFLRVAASLLPPFVVLENVSALTRHSDGFYKREIENGMRDLGYVVESRVLDASNFGVPQRRKRVFFVGRKPGWGFDWPRPTHGPGLGLQPFITVWQAIGDLPPLESDQSRDHYDDDIVPSEYARMMRGQQVDLINHQAPKHPAATIARIEQTPPGEPMYSGFKQRIRLHPDRISPTVVSGGVRPQFAYGHPTQPRGLSIRERARLQSFPDWYFFEGGIVQGRVQTGDAVPPLLAAAIAGQIRASLLAGPSTAAFDALGRGGTLPESTTQLDLFSGHERG